MELVPRSASIPANGKEFSSARVVARAGEATLLRSYDDNGVHDLGSPSSSESWITLPIVHDQWRVRRRLFTTAFVSNELNCGVL